jgi:hypothetical protein
LLAWCRDAAIVELTAIPPQDHIRSAPESTSGSAAAAGGEEPPRWDRLSVLRRIRRDRLEPHLRPLFDELLIDALREIDAFDELRSRLARIPPDQRGSRVWQAIETAAAARLAQLARDRDSARAFARALDLWDEVVRQPWPAGWEFPEQLTARVAAMAEADARRRLPPWHDRLRHALDDLAARPGPSPHAVSLAAERTRIEARLSREQ